MKKKKKKNPKGMFAIGLFVASVGHVLGPTFFRRQAPNLGDQAQIYERSRARPQGPL